MTMNRQQLLEQLMNSYGTHYNLRTFEASQLPLAAECVYHEHSTSYLVVKKAEMWAADRHEYVYLFTLPHLTRERFDWCLAKTLELGQPQVKPGKNHMCSNLVCIILCDTAEDEAWKALKTCRIRKSFRFSFHGWMEVQTAAAELGKETAAGNAAGRNVAKFLKNVLSPKGKRSILHLN